MDLLRQIIFEDNNLTLEVHNLVHKYEVAKDAMILHNNFNQLYCGKPYILHLFLVHLKIVEHLKLIPNQDHDIIVNAGWLHDTIEDCKIDYDYIYEKYGFYTAELVESLTNKPNGMFNHKAILSQHYARFIKLCDRISHLEVNMEILKNRSLFLLEDKEFMLIDAKKYMQKYLDQDYEFRKKLAINDETSIDDFEKPLVTQYKNLITKYLVGKL